MTSSSPSSPRGLIAATITTAILWLLMLAAAIGNACVLHPQQKPLLPEIAALAVAAAAMIVAVRRARGRTRYADAFYPLVLLNPLLYSHHANAPGHVTTLLATALLVLMAAAIITMRPTSIFRYLQIALITAMLALLSNSFLLIVLPLVAWFILSGYLQARSASPTDRTRGFIIMAIGEVGLMLFGIACFLEQPAPPPPPSTLFSTITNFTEFPLLVLAIVMLALGWRKGPHSATPAYFPGILALLVGLLILLLNNFQSGKLPAPGADQTALILCLVYTTFALHGPRRLQWLIPPALLLAAIGYTLFP